MRGSTGCAPGSSSSAPCRKCWGIESRRHAPGHGALAFTPWRSPLGEARKLLHHPLVDRTLERHHEAGEVAHRLPAPFDEFRLVAAGRMSHVDLGLVAGEAQREPLLLLPAVASLPRLADDLARDVVAQPLVDGGEALDRADIGFLV